jgi:hypothetical protein
VSNCNRSHEEKTMCTTLSNPLTAPFLLGDAYVSLTERQRHIAWADEQAWKLQVRPRPRYRLALARMLVALAERLAPGGGTGMVATVR